MWGFFNGRIVSFDDIHYLDKKNLPTQLRKVFGAPSSEMDDVDFLCYVGFMVNGKRRLGDFNTLLTGRLREELFESEKLNEILENIGKYIVYVNRKI